MIPTLVKITLFQKVRSDLRKLAMGIMYSDKRIMKRIRLLTKLLQPVPIMFMRTIRDRNLMDSKLLLKTTQLLVLGKKTTVWLRLCNLLKT